MKKKGIDKKKYGGKYIATRSFTNLKIVACGKDPIEVYNKALEKGIKDPVIDYVPEEGVPQMY